MRRRLPPISALRALEAAARYASFTKAAEKLHVTQSAISHQVKLLEDLWELKLFERKGQRLVVTPMGLELAHVTRDFFDRIEGVLESAQASRAREPLRLDTLQSFAVKWLVPRLGSFHGRHPSIDLWISTHDHLVDFDYNEVDIAIHLGNGNFPGLHATLLLEEEVFPVCTPEFLERVGKPDSPRALLDYPLLLRTGEPAHTNWREWFESAGVTDARLRDGLRFPDTNMALEAAMKGLGVALARTAHVVDELAARQLVRLFSIRCPSNVAYYLLCPAGREKQPSIATFRDWVLGELRTMRPPERKSRRISRVHQPSA